MNEKNNNKNTVENNSNKGLSLRERLAKVRPSRWVRFGIVAVIFIAFVVWLGSPWVLIFLPLLADIYLTQYIPWTWWKESKSPVVRTFMGWVDAILYALILVYFIFAYIGQNYQIPSSSLEKSLLVGDYLWVNKMIYGPRVPNTPLHFPLTQNTLPILNCKSYIDNPQVEYKRLKGFRNVERGDIVVFNFPAGDTVTQNVQNPDYYSLVAQYGREVIYNNKEIFGEVFYRPVDRRENYVKRCLGLPGEMFKIVDDVVYINGSPIADPKNVQFNYFIQTNGGVITPELWDRIGVSMDDRHSGVDFQGLQMLGLDITYDGMIVFGYGNHKVPMPELKFNTDGSFNPIYQAPLTAEMVESLKSLPVVSSIVRVPVQEYINVFPISHNYGWNRANMGEFRIPKKGETQMLTLDNIHIFERVIRNYEKNQLELKNGKIYINGKEADRYTFKMDYYWMMGDNRDNSADSRYWGFVPEDHIVGSPMFILLSIDKDKGLLDGKIRFDRIFRSANPDK